VHRALKTNRRKFAVWNSFIAQVTGLLLCGVNYKLKLN